VVAGVVGDVVLTGQVGGGELVEHLPQRSQPAQQVADHGVGVGRVLEGAGGVREPVQRLVGFAGIGDGIRERRHDGLHDFGVRQVRVARSTVRRPP
jgi:hypothetical protein|tara:strand:- start:8604 stop:8891 length:288 start_codon:yes stop_codon:yes gene_type:complete